MRITLNPHQRVLASRDSLRVAAIARLETYTDKDAGTVDKVYYFASIPMVFEWTGDGVVEFSAHIAGLNPLRTEIEHIPQPDFFTSRGGMSITLDAHDFEGVSLWKDLVIDREIHGARLEVSSLLLPEWDADRPGDQTALASTDRVPRFRGEISNVSEYDYEAGTFTITANTIEPALDWPRARQESEVDPRDLGKRYPIPVGQPKQVPVINREIGRVTTLIENITDVQTGTIQVSDSTGFIAGASGSSMIMMGGEVMSTVNRSDDLTLSIQTRAQLGTTAAVHSQGISVLEVLETIRFVYAGVRSAGVEQLYLVSPSGDRYRIGRQYYTENVGHECASDPDSVLGQISFSQANFISMLTDIAQDIAKQPTLDTAGAGTETLSVNFGAYSSVTGLTGASNCDVQSLTSGRGVLMDYTSLTTKKDAASMWHPDAAVPNQTRGVSRFRMSFTIRIEGNGSNETRVYYNFVNVLNVSRSKTLVATRTASGSEYNTYSTAWFTCPALTTMADLVNSGGGSSSPINYVYLDQSVAGGSGAATELFVDVFASSVECELIPTTSTINATELAGGLRFGGGVTLVADLRGAYATATETVLFGVVFNSVSAWSAIGSSTVTLDASGDGIKSAKITGAGQYGAKSAISFPFPFDTARLILRFKIDSAHAQSTYDATDHERDLVVRLYSSATNWTEYGFGGATMRKDEETTFTLDVARHPATAQWTNGTGANLSAVTDIGFAIDGDGTGGGEFVVRDLTWSTPFITAGLSHCVEQVIGLAKLTTTAIDVTSVLDAQVAAGTPNLSMDLREAGETMASLMARLGYENRASLSMRETLTNSQWAFSSVNLSSAQPYGASTGTITGRDIKISTKLFDEMPTQFEAIWDKLTYIDQSNPEAFREITVVDEVQNDISTVVLPATITAAQTARGKRRAAVSTFLALDAAASVGTIWGWYINEALDSDRVRVSMNVPISTGYSIEAGDIVEWVAPWGPTLSLRVVQVAFAWNLATVGVDCEQVIN